MDNGALASMMSGSGPTVFGLFEQEEQARMAYEQMRKSQLTRQLYLTSIYNNRRRIPSNVLPALNLLLKWLHATYGTPRPEGVETYQISTLNFP